MRRRRMKTICASVNFVFFIEFSSARNRAHYWKIPVENGLIWREQVSSMIAAYASALVQEGIDDEADDLISRSQICGLAPKLEIARRPRGNRHRALSY